MQVNYSFDGQATNRFVQELNAQLPLIPIQLQNHIAHIFSISGNDIEYFKNCVNALGHEFAVFNPKIISIAANIFTNPGEKPIESSSKKREGGKLENTKAKKPRPNAQPSFEEEQKAHTHAFLKQLIDNPEIGDAEENCSLLMAILASQDESIVETAWGCLHRLTRIANYQTFFACNDNLTMLMNLLEEFTKEDQAKSSLTAGVDFLQLKASSSYHGRLIAILFSQLHCGKGGAILETVKCLTGFMLKHDAKEQHPLQQGEVVPLMALLHSRQDTLVGESCMIQVQLGWDETFINGLLAEGIEKIFQSVVSFIDVTQDIKFLKFAFAYLNKLHVYLYNGIDCKPIFDAQLKLLLSLTGHKNLIVVLHSCKGLLANINHSGSYIKAFYDEGGGDTMLNLLQKLRLGYQLAFEMQKDRFSNLKEDEREPQIKLVEQIMLYATKCLSEKCFPYMHDAFKQELCKILTVMLKFPSSTLAIKAANLLVALSATSEIALIGPQCIQQFIDLLFAESEQVAQASVSALKEFAKDVRNHSLLPMAFERMKVLLLHPKDQIVAETLLFFSEYINANDKMDASNYAFLQELILPFLNGKHQLVALQAIRTFLHSTRLQAKVLPEALGQKLLKLIFPFLDSDQELVVAESFWCLGDLAQFNLSEKPFWTDILEKIELLFDTANPPAKLLEKAIYCFAKIQPLFFSDKSIHYTIVCNLSRLLTKKHAKVQEAGLSLLHQYICHLSNIQFVDINNLEANSLITVLPTIAATPSLSHQAELDLSSLNLACLPVVVKNIKSPNGRAATEAILIFRLLSILPYNEDSILLNIALENLFTWLENDFFIIPTLALHCIKTLCMRYVKFKRIVANKLTAALLASMINKSRRFPRPFLEAILETLSLLSDIPESQELLRRLFNEKFSLILLGTYQKIQNELIFILNNIYHDKIFTTNRENAKNLLLTLSDTENRAAFESRQSLLAKLFSREEIIIKLKEIPELKKENFLLFLDIRSRIQKENISQDVSQIKEVTIYSGLFQPHVQNEFSDVILNVNDGADDNYKAILHCHRFVLDSTNSHFRHILRSIKQGDMNKGKDCSINIKDVDVEYFKKLILFLYEQQYQFTSIEDTARLLELAQRFNVSHLEAGCIRFLTAQLTNEVAEEILDFSESILSSALKSEVMQWMMNHYHTLSEALQKRIDTEHWREFYTELTAPKK